MAGQWPACCLGNLVYFLQSNLDCSSSGNLEKPLSQETSSASSVAPSSQDRRHEWDPLDSHRGDTFDMSWYGKTNSRVDCLPLATFQQPEPQDGLWSPSVPLLATEGLKGPISLTEPKGLGPHKTQAPKSILSQPSKLSKVTQSSQKSQGAFLSLCFSDKLFLEKLLLEGVRLPADPV